MPSSVSACLLVRDDASTLVECLESIRPHVDELCILDTGSTTDDSEAIAKKYADKWERWTGCNDEAGLIADFAAARNRSYAMASHDCVFWMDADDIFIGGEHLRELAERQSALGAFAVLIPYEYAHDGNGNVVCYHYRENLAGPKGSFHWEVPVHEVLVPDAPTTTMHAHELMPGVDIRRVHRKQKSKKPPDKMRNLRILHRYVQQRGETDVRALYYLGVEQALMGDQNGNALMTLRRYVELASWSDEKCLATLEIGMVYAKLGDYEMAVEWALKASVMKSWCEPYFLISRCYFLMAEERGKDQERNYRRAARFAQQGLQMAETKTVLFVNPLQRAEIHYVLNVALARLGDIEGAAKSCRAGLSVLIGDADLQKNLAEYEGTIGKQTIVRALTSLEKGGKLDQDFAIKLSNKLAEYAAHLESQPKGLPGELPPEAFGECKVPTQEASAGCLDISLFVGPQYEPWNPETLATTGMGGSEVMAWEMAKRLRALGHRVRVFGHCNPEHEGLFDGVEWLAYQRFHGSACDVLITSRRPEAVDHRLGVEAKVRILYVHDVHVGEAWDFRRDLRIDRVFALTNWHKAFLCQVYPNVDPDKIVVTRNGIDYGRFRSMPAPLPMREAKRSGIVNVAEHPLAPGIPRYEVPGYGIIIGGGVSSAEDWTALETLGVTHVLCLTDPPDQGVPADRLLHAPIPDEGQPLSVAYLQHVLRFARSALAGGGLLYVHCWVGRSRSPSIAYGIIRHAYGVTKEAALSAINSVSPWPDGFGNDPKHKSYMASVEAALTDDGPPRHPHRLVYSSSPDRGLHILLDLWPQIRREIPDAELRVAYGFLNWEIAAKARNGQELERLEHIKAGLAQPGVTAIGRVNAAELTREFLAAGVWAYPTWFSETSCITAMEAQAAGLHIVATPVAALNETLAPPAVLVPGVIEDPYAKQTPEFLAEFYHQTIQAMRRAEVGPAEYPKRHGLDELAKEWDSMLREWVTTIPGTTPRFRG